MVTLEEVFLDCLKQTQEKGMHRHAVGDEPFSEQPLFSILEKCGYGFAFGQSMKKMMEAQKLIHYDKRDEAYQEILGAINYMAAAAMYVTDYTDKETWRYKEKERTTTFLEEWFKTLNYNTMLDMVGESNLWPLEEAVPRECKGKEYSIEGCKGCDHSFPCRVIDWAKEVRGHYSAEQKSEEKKVVKQ